MPSNAKVARNESDTLVGQTWHTWLRAGLTRAGNHFPSRNIEWEEWFGWDGGEGCLKSKRQVAQARQTRKQRQSKTVACRQIMCATCVLRAVLNNHVPASYQCVSGLSQYQGSRVAKSKVRASEISRRHVRAYAINSSYPTETDV